MDKNAMENENKYQENHKYSDNILEEEYPIKENTEDTNNAISLSEEPQEENLIGDEEDFFKNGSAFSVSAKLVNPQIHKKTIIPRVKEEFSIYPFEPGFGLTIGNTLRRIMLSHMTGFAIAAVKIFGCSHKFQSLAGIRENTCDILMNLKEVAISVEASNNITSFMGTIDITGPGDVLAKHIIMEHGTVCNPEHFICHVDVNGSFKASMLICFGRGYVMAENNKCINTTINDDNFLENAIIMDSTYNHIKHVEYSVEPTRVEEKTNYDKLILKIETTGAITPKDCLGRSYQLLWHQMSPIKNFDNFDIHVEEQEREQNKVDIPDIMFIPVTKVGLSTRVRNGLEVNNIDYIGDLVTKTEQELTRSPRIGKESIREIKNVLANLNFDLSLGMTIKGWRPANVEKISDMIIKEDLVGA
jgi:DNA-directed RNA polymerase subunit alpha